ncbi:MAG: hypothetical protein MI922_07420, partial [Bacteroidales bacterium]|nr:hypothetical protein [Bacteroidales bacterium]
RDTDFSNIKNCGTSLLLSPGAVQIFYGDEVARPEKKTKATDPTHGYRSDFVWGENLDVLEHWQKLGQFRKRHLAIGMGNQKVIGNNTFLRTYIGENISDTVIIKIATKEHETINVSNIFKNGTKLRDAYSGQTAVVMNDTIRFNPLNNIILIESANN